MTSKSDFVPLQRPDGDLAGRWCLYSAREDRWLDIVFGSMDEAREASEVLQRMVRRASPSGRSPLAY